MVDIIVKVEIIFYLHSKFTHTDIHIHIYIVFVYLYTMLGFYFAGLLARILDANAINILCLLNVPLFISPHAGKKAYPKHRAHKIIITIIVQHDIQPQKYVTLISWFRMSAGTSQYMYVEFVTSPAGPLLNTGFHFNVGNWPGHVETAGIKHGICDWLLSSDSLRDSSASEGIFLSIAHWYPPNTSCSYHIKGRLGEIVRLYFPR